MRAACRYRWDVDTQNFVAGEMLNHFDERASHSGILVVAVKAIEWVLVPAPGQIFLL